MYYYGYNGGYSGGNPMTYQTHPGYYREGYGYGYSYNISTNMRGGGGNSIHNRKNNINLGINDENSRDQDIREKGRIINNAQNNLLVEQINDKLRIVYLELGIYYCYDLFVKHLYISFK